MFEDGSSVGVIPTTPAVAQHGFSRITEKTEPRFYCISTRPKINAAVNVAPWWWGFFFENLLTIEPWTTYVSFGRFFPQLFSFAYALWYIYNLYYQDRVCNADTVDRVYGQLRSAYALVTGTRVWVTTFLRLASRDSRETCSKFRPTRVTGGGRRRDGDASGSVRSHVSYSRLNDTRL